MTHRPNARLAPSSWLRLPSRTARLRLTALYGALFLFSGLALLASTYILFERATATKTPHLPSVPHTRTIQKLRTPRPSPSLRLKYLQNQLRRDKQQLKLLPVAIAPGPRAGLLAASPQLTQDQHRLEHDQRQLSQAVHQLAQALDQVAQNNSVDAAQRASDSRELLVDSGIALAVVGVLALLGGWLVAGRILRPIRTITRTARRISSTSLHERLALDGPQDELKELGDTLDDLLARLEAAFEAQRRFVAHASHELRTPLTRERAVVQVALGDPSTSDVWRSAGQELLDSNREQETLIDALLTLASSERGLDGREPVDLSDIARAVANERCDNQGLGLHIDANLKPASLDGDPRLIECLIVNLVDNAVTHNVEGGSVHISTGSDDGQVLLTVTNTGPVIPSAEIDRLFQPFQRLDRNRVHRSNRHGLGLSIVRAIANSHEATISVEPQPEGGLTLSVAFPAATGPGEGDRGHQPGTTPLSHAGA